MEPRTNGATSVGGHGSGSGGAAAPRARSDVEVRSALLEAVAAAAAAAAANDEEADEEAGASDSDSDGATYVDDRWLRVAPGPCPLCPRTATCVTALFITQSLVVVGLPDD
jgi:hypothetical protein